MSEVYKCSYCGEEFESIWSCLEHLDAYHLDEEDLEYTEDFESPWDWVEAGYVIVSTKDEDP